MQSHILVLNGPADSAAIDDQTVKVALDTLQAHGQPAEPHWLRPGHAIEIPVAFANPSSAAHDASANLRTAFAGRPLDVNILADASPRRRKRLLIADMDSTIIQQECIDEIAARAGVGERVADITERAMRGELDFEAALTERVCMLTGLDEKVLQEVYDNQIQLTPGAGTLARTMAAHGAHCALVSGGFTFFTSRVAQQAGFHEHMANQFVVNGGKLTGDVARPILGRAAKLETLETLTRTHQLSLSDALAVGDGANDLAMIDAAGLGVAFRAKPVVAQQADAMIEHGDLTALLYLQGYTFDAFAAAA